MARWTGLEPATPGVTGRYSNQLSYHRASSLAQGPPDVERVIAKPRVAVNGFSRNFIVPVQG